MKKLHLYTTLGCHLCEEAKTLSWPLLAHYGYRLEEVEIADSDELMESYGVRIPVLHRVDNGAELAWPFDEQQLDVLLRP